MGFCHIHLSFPLLGFCRLFQGFCHHSGISSFEILSCGIFVVRDPVDVGDLSSGILSPGKALSGIL